MAHPADWIDASSDELVADIATRSLKGRLDLVKHYLPLAAKDWEQDVEHVHQLRIWTRRAQAAMSMYLDWLPWRRASWINTQVKRIRRASNDARDDDVLAARLALDQATPGAVRLLERVREHRLKAQRPIVQIHRRLKKDQLFDRRVRTSLKRVRPRGRVRKSDPKSFGPWAAVHFRPVLRDFLQAGQADLSDVTALHQFRICGKKLRYAMELLGTVFPAKFRDEVYPIFQVLQEKLGTVNDHATAQARFRHWIEEDDDPERLDYLRHMLDNEDQLLEQSREDFFSWWTPEHQIELRQAFEEAVGEQPAASMAHSHKGEEGEQSL